MTTGRINQVTAINQRCSSSLKQQKRCTVFLFFSLSEREEKKEKQGVFFVLFADAFVCFFVLSLFERRKKTKSFDA